jgi:predicted amidohydrolase YtcJ
MLFDTRRRNRAGTEIDADPGSTQNGWSTWYGVGRRTRFKTTLSMKMRAIANRTRLLLSLSLLSIGCQREAVTTAEPADLILKNGAVCTMDAQRSWQTAVVVSRGRIQYVGSDAGALPFQGPKTKVLDLEGNMVLPGLHDAHVHLADGGLAPLLCSLVGLKTEQQSLAAVAAYAKAHPELEWIVGGGWELTWFAPGRPNRAALDRVVRDRPVLLYGGDGHSAWANTKALREARITKVTPDPEGGRIERDSTGEPTGLVWESAVNLLVDKAPPTSRELYAEGLRQGLKRANSLGLTSVFEANATPGVLQAYRDLDVSNELTVRVVAALETKPLEGVSQVSSLVAERNRAAGRRLRPTAAKIFVDGVIEGHTAALLQPYVGTDDLGLLNFAPSALNQLVTALAKEGFPVHFHAIGDRAVQSALDSIEASQATATPDLRHNVAHLELIRPQDLPRFRQLAAVANFQPRWAYQDEDVRELTEPAVGPERSQRLYPIGSVLRTGARLAAGSDWPVSSLDPLEGIQVAVTRRALDAGPGEPWLPNEIISLMDVLAAYTIDGAYALHQERETGSVDVGKLADLVVLDRNLFQQSPDSLSRARVLRTFVEGEEVYTAPGLVAGEGSVHGPVPPADSLPAGGGA